MKIRITLEDTATQALRNLAMGVGDRAGLHRAVATGLIDGVQDHLIQRYVPRDRGGVEFWKRAADSVSAISDDEGAEVSINHPGVRLRYTGGEVRPGAGTSSRTGRKTTALALPTDRVPVANGARIPPGKAGPLAFIPLAKGRETVGVLVQGREVVITRGRNKGKRRVEPVPGGGLMYVLRSITRHRADPNIFPDDQRLLEITRTAFAAHLAAYEE